MTLLDEIHVTSCEQERTLALYLGDLAAIPRREAVDLLVISAFPDDYGPTSASLVGALHRAGLSVAALARHKAVDLRRFSSCWLSEEIPESVAPFRRLLCFEPLVRGTAPEVVGDVFRSLIPFCAGTPPIRQIAMPILAAGDQRESPVGMLNALVEAAVHWFSIGLPLTRIKIVIRAGGEEHALAAAFRGHKAHFNAASAPAAKTPRFDAFLSYSHKDKAAADHLLSAMRQARPSLRLFVDRLDLQAGAAWQQHIFEALDDCRKVISLLSPAYLESKVCKEEFNVALFRHRESLNGVLVPIFLQSADLPTYMKLIQAIDVREGDVRILDSSVSAIIDSVLR
jgi:hypothetical protein